MIITKIELENTIFLVTLKPNFIEKFFGVKERVEKYKDAGSNYVFGGGNIYTNQKGERTGNGSYIGESIDKWRRKF